MRDSLDARIERVWQFLMVVGQDQMARDIAEAKQVLLRQAAQLRGEPQVITICADDDIDTADGAG